MKSSLIELKDIHKSYFSGDLETKVLHGIDVTIKEGEFVTIMGPSGSGKSTLLNIIGLLDDLTNGEYFFKGKQIDTYSEKEKAVIRNQQMGFIFQAFNLLPRTSVLENVKLPLLYSQIPSKQWHSMAEKAIDSVGLSHRIHHDPGQLSGGEKQRVAIARALVCEPSVVFADEPTGNLDSKTGITIMQVIKDLHKAGKTIILITHETRTAEYAERLVRIVDGKVGTDRAITGPIHNQHTLK